jgi:hypothetical protein
MYIGLFGGMLGSATSWLGSGPWAHGDSSVNTLGQMISLLSYLSGLLAIVGGIVAFSNTRVGGIILAGSAFSHWYLLGFGVIGKVFILPIGAAAAFAFFAARSGLQAAPSGSSANTSAQTRSSGGAPFDRAKWNALVQYDKDIAAIAERLQPLGGKWLDEFASSYLALNDKKYIPNIEQKIVAAAKAETEENERQKEQWRIRTEEQQKAYQQEMERNAQARKEQFELWRGRLWGNRQRQFLTTFVGVAVVLCAVVVAWPKKYSDPFAYCSAIVNIESPDSRYVGPRYPQVVLDAVMFNKSDAASWRCLDGKLIGCKYGSRCEKPKWIEKQFPSTDGKTVRAWTSNGPGMHSYESILDKQGYYVENWAIVTPNPAINTDAPR